MTRWPALVAIALLLATWGSLQILSHSEPILSKKAFADFPLTIAERWRGKELGIEQSVLDVLKLTDYMMRAYADTAGSVGPHTADGVPVWLYVGYYKSQRTGATYHSPKNCLPGAGWQFMQSEEVAVSRGEGPPSVINKVLIQKGLDQQVILYWYHDRGRIIASEYWAKGYMIWDSFSKHRTDGALVRISVPVINTPEEAYRHSLDFLHDIWPLLNEYLT